MPLDPISYSLAKKAKKIAESHATRHQPGGADPLPTAVPTDITVGATASEGTSTSFARADHVHGTPSTWPADILLVLKDMTLTDGIFWFNNNWAPDSLSSYVGGSGVVTWAYSYVRLNTGTTSSSYAHIRKVVAYPLKYSWEAKRYFRAVVQFYWANTNAYLWIVSGYLDYNASGAIYQHIGFKMINGLLYGTVADGSAESTLLLEDLSANSRAYRFLTYEYTPGVEARFYVDGVDKGAITTNLPSGSAYANYLFQASVYNTAAEAKLLYIYEARVFQEPP